MLFIIDQVLGFLEAGGVIMYLLTAASMLCLTVAIAKFLQIKMAGISYPDLLDPIMRGIASSDKVAVAGLIKRLRTGPIQDFLQESSGLLLRNDVDKVTQREEIMRLAMLEVDRQRSGIRIMGLIAAISPLLGLLGTVIGMIDAFQALEAAGNRVDPSILSGGIWVALLTTAAGLVVAIPASLIHSWMEGQAEKATRILEDISTRLLTATDLAISDQ